jgi:hypothetical protein
LPWLAYLWGVGQQGNPLLAGVGMPSAAFVEAAHAMTQIELTPGLSSNASCPEALWTSAVWWHGYYETTAKDRKKTSNVKLTREDSPLGVYTTRQRSAAIYDPGDPGEELSPPPPSSGQSPARPRRKR